MGARNIRALVEVVDQRVPAAEVDHERQLRHARRDQGEVLVGTDAEVDSALRGQPGDLIADRKTESSFERRLSAGGPDSGSLRSLVTWAKVWSRLGKTTLGQAERGVVRPRGHASETRIKRPCASRLYDMPTTTTGPSSRPRASSGLGKAVSTVRRQVGPKGRRGSGKFLGSSQRCRRRTGRGRPARGGRRVGRRGRRQAAARLGEVGLARGPAVPDDCRSRVVARRQEGPAAEDMVSLPKRDQLASEPAEVGVLLGERPVEPTRLVVLAPGVVRARCRSGPASRVAWTRCPTTARRAIAARVGCSVGRRS